MRYRFPQVGVDLRQPFSQAPAPLRDHVRAGVSRDVPVYFPSFRRVAYSVQPVTEGGLILSRPGCVVLRRGGLPVQRRSPTQALTGPNIE